MTVAVISVVVPWPSAADRGWTARATETIARQAPRRVEGRCRVELVLLPPDRDASEPDRLAGAAMDALRRAGVIGDGSAAHEVRMRWEDATPGGPGCVVAHVEPV